ncbi:nuclease-related domain-containing protein [Geomonas anaerohicana]|uniref:NERD domain-containing protein n=1 Tax=Geomonas anaerohicana TaxID=2798583 RepID=A0ABS0YFD1_9BACT|nr:nuclease-related domain-containing protein [Geomonas anaerohicana]MBJ6751000.1 NERD domain-containing protein [Geomonas anaerohicana]
MNEYLIQYIPVVIFLLSLCVPVGIALWIRYQRRQRRNPLNYDMLRAPGESISKRIDLLNDDIELYFTFSGIAPLFCYTMYLSTHYITSSPASPFTFIILALGFLTFFGVKLNKLIRQRHKEQLGLDCERAVGQELNQLMLDGYRVYHDFQADNFNIDHIAIGNNGVFAIETKGRPKPNRNRGHEDAKVVYDGNLLQFPMWREKEPLEQTRRQAVWLSGWLSKAVGQPVHVKPVLALPGWFVERKAKDLLIYNGRNPQYLLKVSSETSLRPEMIQQIAYQIEQRCRDVAPQAYKKN